MGRPCLKIEKQRKSENCIQYFRQETLRKINITIDEC